jgi:putative Holliday junction resolvase
MPRYLGIDYGTKRIGLAISDVDGRIASPLSVIARPPALADQVRAVLRGADEFGFDEIVVGIPLNMDGSVGPQADLTRRFVAALRGALAAPVHEWDERLTSRAADELMAPRRLTNRQRKDRRDALAAQVLLQGFLDAQTSPGDSSQNPGD